MMKKGKKHYEIRRFFIKYDINPAKYLSTDILNREIKAIKAGDGEFRVLLEEGDDD